MEKSLKLQIGSKSGYSPETLYDAETDEGVCMVYGIPMHITMEEYRQLGPRYAKGVERSAHIVRCVNSHAELLEALKMALMWIETSNRTWIGDEYEAQREAQRQAREYYREGKIEAAIRNAEEVG